MLNYMIYILAFVIGSILGLVYSYKQHNEPFVAVNSFNVIFGVLAIIGWILAFNAGNIILSTIGFLLAGFVMGERPGYGRKESFVGLVVSIFIYLLLHWSAGGVLHG